MARPAQRSEHCIESARVELVTRSPAVARREKRNGRM